MPLSGDLIPGQKVESDQTLGDGEPASGVAACSQRIQQFYVCGAGSRISVAVQIFGIFREAGNVGGVSLSGLRQQGFSRQRITRFKELAGTVQRFTSEQNRAERKAR